MSDSTPKPRRWLSPGWWLFAGLVACLILVGVRLVLPWMQIESLKQEVARLGGRVVTQPGGPAWLRKRLGDRAMSGFDKVIDVTVSSPNLTDDWMHRLHHFPEIESLSVRESPVGSTGVAHLAGLRNLRDVWLYGTRLGDRGLEVLSRMPTVRTISAGYTPITDEGLRHVGRMAQLQYFGIRGTRITDAGLAHLEGLTELTGLFLGETDITDAGLPHLLPMQRLESLWLHETDVTAAGILQVAQLPHLRELHVSQSQMTADAMDELSRIRPGLTVVVRVSEDDGSGFSHRRRSRYWLGPGRIWRSDSLLDTNE